MSSDKIELSRQAEYDEIIAIIERTRENTFRAVNREFVSMYWEIGKYVSGKVQSGGWGKSVVSDFARFIQSNRPDLKGFSASNVWRMRQFYKTYRDNEKLATLSREITWSNNCYVKLHITKGRWNFTSKRLIAMYGSRQKTPALDSYCVRVRMIW